MITRAMEDYLETIYWLSKEKGSAKVSDISQTMGVRLPSVSEMMKRLKDKGLVEYEPYGEVTLTEKGREVAMRIAARHELLASFFMALGVEKKIALEDACKVEHDLHPDTLKRLRTFIKFVAERSMFSKFSEYVSEEEEG
ncbi:MAG: metal-dependent transcriptional regulator [Thermoproteota archaeon]|nr:MAG: metal-dependent transcriptional regulator [Candidatus Korarchaeota archaeon]